LIVAEVTIADHGKGRLRMLARVMIPIAIILLLAGALWADEAAQTDWCGGGGVPGPVTDWAEEFDTSAGLSYLALPGQLALSASALASPVGHLIDSSYVGTIGVAVGDIDGDGDTDIVGTASNSGMLVWWENDGGDPPSLTEYTIGTPPGAAGVDVADIDGDGRLDVIVALDEPRNKLVWKRNLGGDPIAWGSQVIESTWRDAWEVGACDVNGDGNMDVIAPSWAGANASWWENDGGDPIVWTRHVVGTIAGAHSIRGADIDEDGDMDMAVAAGVANKIVVYWSDGADSITWTAQDVQLNFIGARSVRIADIDQDGDLDLAGISWTSDVTWWSNDGGDPVVWAPQTISTSADGGHAVYVADMNGDNRPDVLGACVNNNRMAWWENGGGDPIVWTMHSLDNHYVGSITVRAADLNQDGVMDAVGAAWTAGRFDWWETSEFDSAGQLTSSILDAGAGTDLGEIDWTSTEPSGTSLRFQVRSSNDPGDLGAWTGDITTPGSLGASLDRYIQYRVFMDTADPDHSPILEDVTFRSGQAGVETDAIDLSDSRLIAHPNPFNPHVSISFGLRTADRIRLQVFDVRGRMVRQITDRRLEAGDHRLSWDGTDDGGQPLSSGIYWLCLERTGVRETREVVLLR
jgi:hypothetical protein